MAKIKQSLAWWCFGQRMASADLIAQAKRIGYDGVEMAPRDLWQQILDGGLKVITEGGHNGISEGFNRKENHDRIEKEIVANLEVARKWGIPRLIVFSGERKGLDDEKGKEVTAQGLQRVAKAAEQAGVTLVLELLNSKVDHKDYQCDHTAWGVEVCKLVNSPNVKLLYDIYHMQIQEGDVIRNIRDYIQYIGHFHTAGNPGRNELDENQELYYPAIMRTIAATEFGGWVGQELVPKGDPLAALEQAYKVCDV